RSRERRCRARGGGRGAHSHASRPGAGREAAARHGRPDRGARTRRSSMTSAAVRAFRERGLAPKKSFGQNFLVDPNVARRIAELSTTGWRADDHPSGGTVVEIGAGLGALTEPLLARAARVVAIERDRDLCPILRERDRGRARWRRPE